MFPCSIREAGSSEVHLAAYCGTLSRHDICCRGGDRCLGYLLFDADPGHRGVSRQTNSAQLRQAYLGEMRQRLQLSPEQEKGVTEILDQTRELFRQVSDKHRPEFRAIQDHQSEMIRALLDPKQQAEYEALRSDRMEMARRKGNGN